MRPARRQVLRLGTGALVAAGIGLPSVPAGARQTSWIGGEGAVRGRIRPPRFRAERFPITRYGATPADATAGIAAAISACHQAGGGHVVVPPGLWHTGAIHLLSHVDLHLEEGATLRFSTDPAAYLPVVRTRWQSVEVYNYSSLIRADGQTDIGITGKGVLDGAGDNEHWWYWIGSGQYGWHEGLPNQRADWGELERMNNEQVPLGERVFGAGHYLRPSFVQPFRCTNVLIEGVTIKDSPMWTIHPLECRNVTVRGVTVENLGPNGDGCNPESCTDVLIRDCTFATHDDCIAIKSGRDADGRRLGLPSRGIIVENCHFLSGGAAVAVGSEMSGGVHDVYVRRLTAPADPAADEACLQWLLCVKSTSTRGGYVHTVDVRDVDSGAWMYRPLEITFSYQGGGDQSLFPDVHDIRLDRIRVARAERAYRIVGAESRHIRSVAITNSRFGQVAAEAVVQYADDVTIRNVRISTSLGDSEWRNGFA
ncbi:glycoside hydrolase family 28 protein [Kribbella sp. NPDC048915]|uniref:glycoside hydrolase family 28 protein n=1 Tax=Kribbella sp. NPDC048915 TaxID=3155148 RepID=UPI0033DE22B7